jgi:hypothetical protein
MPSNNRNPIMKRRELLKAATATAMWAEFKNIRMKKIK